MLIFNSQFRLLSKCRNFQQKSKKVSPIFKYLWINKVDIGIEEKFMIFHQYFILLKRGNMEA